MANLEVTAPTPAELLEWLAFQMKPPALDKGAIVRKLQEAAAIIDTANASGRTAVDLGPIWPLADRLRHCANAIIIK